MWVDDKDLGYGWATRWERLALWVTNNFYWSKNNDLFFIFKKKFNPFENSRCTSHDQDFSSSVFCLSSSLPVSLPPSLLPSCHPSLSICCLSSTHLRIYLSFCLSQLNSQSMFFQFYFIDVGLCNSLEITYSNYNTRIQQLFMHFTN